MKRTLVTLAFLLGSAAFALAGPHDDVDNVGRCLVFSYVRAGLDGQKEIPKSLVDGMNFLMGEYNMRAATVGLDEKARQAFIVQTLEEQNRVVKLDGLAALETKYKTLCSNISQALLADLKSKSAQASQSKP